MFAKKWHCAKTIEKNVKIPIFHIMLHWLNTIGLRPLEFLNNAQLIWAPL